MDGVDGALVCLMTVGLIPAFVIAVVVVRRSNARARREWR
jgi:hypothetical protein